jgi:hypothetical protein
MAPRAELFFHALPLNTRFFLPPNFWRGLLGTMVDHAHMSHFAVEDFGRVDEHVLAKIHEDINESPMSILGMDSPRQVLQTLLLSGGAA